MMTFRSLTAALVLCTGAQAMDFATHGAQMLEQYYIEDCQQNPYPHGYYGAFFQPCEFSFYEASKEVSNDMSACTDPSSTLLAKPVPMHWFFNLTDHYNKNDWDSIDWDDQNWDEIAHKLFLWPDQCVGVGPRCYGLTDNTIFDALNPLFSKNSIPDGATHVQVNCQADAWQLSRTVFAFADGFEKSMPTIIAWVVTMVLLTIVALAFCIYGCVRLCRRRPRDREYRVHAVPLTGHKYQAVDDIDTEMTYPQQQQKK